MTESLGWSNFRGIKKKVFIRDEDRTRHVYIAGKPFEITTVMWIALQDIKGGRWQ